MEKLWFKIDSELNISDKFNVKFTNESNSENYYVAGDLIGSIINSKVYDSKDTINLIKRETFGIEFICRNLIGSCYIIIEKDSHISIFCSSTAPSIYYVQDKDKLHFFNTEIDIYKNFGKIEQIDEDQIIAHIISHHILMRTPFDSLFKNIKKSPPGSTITVKKNNLVKTDLYIMRSIISLNENKPSNNFKKQVKEFSFLIENIIQLQANYYKNRKLILSKSGGLDSSVLASVLKSKNIKITDSIYIPYNEHSSSKNSLAKLICNYLDLPCSELSPSKISSSTNKLRAISSLNSLPGSQYLYFTPEFNSKSEIEKNIYISGQNLDTLYSVDNFSPGTLSVGFEKLKKTIMKSRLRFLYTKTSLQLLSFKSKLMKRILNLIFRSDVDLNFKNFLITNSTQIREHVFPLKELTSEYDIPINIYAKYKNHRYNKLALPFLKLIKVKSDKTDIEDLPYRLKNHYLRILRFLRTVQNVTTMYHNLSTIENRVRILPYNEGPMVEYFLNYNLTLNDTVRIKRILKKYFKDNVGLNHEVFVKRFLDEGVKKNDLSDDIIRNEQETIKHLKKLINHNKSFLLKNLKNKSYKDFIKNLYSEVENYSSLGYAKKSMIFYRLINLDLYLKQNINN